MQRLYVLTRPMNIGIPGNHKACEGTIVELMVSDKYPSSEQAYNVYKIIAGTFNDQYLSLIPLSEDEKSLKEVFMNPVLSNGYLEIMYAPKNKVIRVCWGDADHGFSYGSAKMVGQDQWSIQRQENEHADKQTCETPTGWYPE